MIAGGHGNQNPNEDWMKAKGKDDIKFKCSRFD